MTFLRRYAGWTAAVAAGIALAAACSDRNNPVTPSPGSGGTGGGTSPGVPIEVAAIACQADLGKRVVSCDAPVSGDRLPSYLLVGGQNVYVKLTSSNVNYDAGTQAFTFDVTVRNLIPQALGTADGTTLDAAGVRVFFSDGPVVTGGSGTVTVVGDGVGTFTAAGQPYYQYNAVLDPYQLSSPRTWQLNVPGTVSTFNFVLLVAAAVRYPDGYIDLLGNPNLRSGSVRTLRAVVRSPVGNQDTSAVITGWSTSDATLAGIGGGTDTLEAVHGYRYGAPVVSVTAQRHNYGNALVSVGGSIAMNVLAVRRVWTGATDDVWETGSNWLPDSVVPVPQDTAVVPDTTSAVNFPTLTASESVAGVEVLDLTAGGVVPTVNLGAFDLSASGDVLTTNSAAIANTSGTLFLTGTGGTVAGTLPFLQVTGTYSLIGDITVRAPLRVEPGRLTSTSFRVQAQSF